MKYGNVPPKDIQNVIWGSDGDLASYRHASDMIEYLDKQIKQAEDNGFTIKWEAW